MNQTVTTRLGACLLVGVSWCVFGDLESTARAQCNPQVVHYCDSCTCGHLWKCFLLDWHKTWHADVHGHYNPHALHGIYSPCCSPAACTAFMYHPEHYGMGVPMFTPIDAPPPLPETEEQAPQDGVEVSPLDEVAFHVSTRPCETDSNAQEWVFEGGVKLQMTGKDTTSVEADQIIVQLPRDTKVHIGNKAFSASAAPQRVRLVGHVRMGQGEDVMVVERVEFSPQSVKR